MTQLPDVPLGGLYGDVIMDHYRHPRCRQSVPNADLVTHDFNPFCGDEVTLQLKLDDSRKVVAVSSHSEGCSIIQASASMLAEAMAGLTLAELTALSKTFRDMMQGKPAPEDASSRLGNLEALRVVRQYPVRIKCALLPWVALEQGILNYHRHNSGG
jgi:nitrogen fixation NifU-like protein